MFKIKLIRKILLFLIIFILGLFNSIYTQTISDSLAKQVDALFNVWDKSDSPGCALGVIKDGKLIYARGYGMADLEHNLPITPNSVFYVGSVSKQFVAMCILLLEESGKLSLDDEVQKFLPELPRYEKPITIRHLIHHTSGLRDYLTLWRLSGRDYLDYMNDKTVLDLICHQKELNFPPGEEFLYSNSGYFLLAEIVKRVSGKSLKEFASENIFKPLGMNNSHFHDDHHHIIKNRAFGYTKLENGQFGNLFMRFDLVGSGGLYTTVDDLFLWDQNFYHNKLGKGGPGLINKMLERGWLSNGKELDYAFALQHGTYRGAKTVSHGGALGGYRAQLLRFPDLRFSVIILSNLAQFNPTEMAYKVADIFLANHLGPRETKTEPLRTTQESSPEIHLKPERLVEYTGRYFSDELQAFYNFKIVDSKLWLYIFNNPPIPLRPVDEDVFESQFRITFQRNANGKISGFRLDAGRVKNLLFVRARK